MTRVVDGVFEAGEETEGGEDVKGATCLPVALARAVLFDLLGVGVEGAVLGEVARQMLLVGSSTVGQAGVVAVVELVRASHWNGREDQQGEPRLGAR